MDENKLLDSLVTFGLTRQQAIVYLSLMRRGAMSGYEVAKDTGISKSNAYKTLATLVTKGAAYQQDGNSMRYDPVEISEFCNNKLRLMKETAIYLEENAPKKEEQHEFYMTLREDRHISDKIRNMLGQVDKRIYLSGPASFFKEYADELQELLLSGRKVVILTDISKKEFTNSISDILGHKAKIYETESKEGQIGIITDSAYVLTGTYGNGSASVCLYSNQINFVQVFKDSMSNEIKLIELSKGE